jgi:hypothetical protein
MANFLQHIADDLGFCSHGDTDRDTGSRSDTDVRSAEFSATLFANHHPRSA